MESLIFCPQKCGRIDKDRGYQLVFPSLAASANIYYMATAKQNQGRSGAVSRAPVRKASTSKNQSLQRLYARLEKTQPGSEESKRISQQIVDAIG
jgi:hypothetical protein